MISSQNVCKMIPAKMNSHYLMHFHPSTQKLGLSRNLRPGTPVPKAVLIPLGHEVTCMNLRNYVSCILELSFRFVR